MRGRTLQRAFPESPKSFLNAIGTPREYLIE